MQELVLSKTSESLVQRAAYVLRVHVWLLVFVTGYMAAAIIAAEVTGRILWLPWSYLRFLGILIGALGAWGVACYTVYIVWRDRPQRPLRHVADSLATRVITLERCLGTAIATLALFFHATAFSFFKCLIPTIQPYTWDERLAAVDRQIHFGWHPWEHLQTVLTAAWMTRFIDFAYVLWLPAITVGVVCFVLTDSSSRLRMQFLLTNMLGWCLLGTILGTALASGGPCYYEHFAGGTSPYQPLMEYLTATDAVSGLKAIAIQEWLWEGLLNEETKIGYGISAMPSLHVAVPFMFVLAFWNVNRIASYCLLGFTALIMVGSVHLAWHYAIDGYVALAGVGAIWWGVGRLLARDSVFE